VEECKPLLCGEDGLTTEQFIDAVAEEMH